MQITRMLEEVMGIRKWWGLRKVVEEGSELAVELMKLEEFPSGKHPGRKRSLILSTEDELADALASIDYFIDRNKLDRKRIERRKTSKYKKFIRWWGDPAPNTVKDKVRHVKRALKKTSRSKV